MSEQQQEWGPWVEHDGKGCPLPVGTQFGAYDEDSAGTVEYFEATALARGGFSWDWQWSKKPVPGIGNLATRIIRYRIRRPKGMAILNAILADLPAPVKTDGVIA